MHCFLCFLPLPKIFVFSVYICCCSFGNSPRRAVVWYRQNRWNVEMTATQYCTLDNVWHDGGGRGDCCTVSLTLCKHTTAEKKQNRCIQSQSTVQEGDDRRASHSPPPLPPLIRTSTPIIITLHFPALQFVFFFTPGLSSPEEDIIIPNTTTRTNAPINFYLFHLVVVFVVISICNAVF